LPVFQIVEGSLDRLYLIVQVGQLRTSRIPLINKFPRPFIYLGRRRSGILPLPSPLRLLLMRLLLRCD
jgi:hypothetical protein